MSQDSAWAFLESIWSDFDATDLTCCQCHTTIETSHVLARTFSLKSQTVSTDRQWAQTIDVPALPDTIIVYHRHLKCLFEWKQYVVISHVWHGQVADLQYNKRASLAVEVEKIVREVPAQIAQKLKDVTDLPRDFEVWHDYISVPQWTPSLKSQIIGSIPKLFQKAWMTVASISDVELCSIDQMRNGGTAEQRCRGISDLCNAKWLSRVWTAMELTQSQKLRAMAKEFALIDEDPAYKSIVTEIMCRWRDEIRRHGNSHDLERMAGIGNNLVPWQLGPLQEVMTEVEKGKPTPFGTAHELLARRCVTIERDFFHALLGLTKPGKTEDNLDKDNRRALLEAAKYCVEKGDLSPLFMIPAWAQPELDSARMKWNGYLALETFAIGHLQNGPGFPEVRFDGEDIVLQAEKVGEVRFVERVAWQREGRVRSLAILSKLALDCTGLDVKKFAMAIGVRLYGQQKTRVLERLGKKDRDRLLLEQLELLYNTWPEASDGIAHQIADLVGLSGRSLGGGYHESEVSPMQFIEAHGGTMHKGPKDHDSGGVIVGVRCLKCHETSLLRAALYKPATDLLGTKAYRIPGLQHWFTHPGGMGFLLKEKQIVGRFIWGTPTCDCSELEDGVRVVLDEPPPPQPNNFRYGHTGV